MPPEYRIRNVSKRKPTKLPPPSTLFPFHFPAGDADVLHSPIFHMADLRASTAAALRPIRDVVSTSSLYPFKGIWYFCVHPEFYPLFGRRLIPLTFVSAIVLGLLFAFTYLPQVAFLAIWHGPGAWFNAAFLVLGEGQLLIAVLFEALLVDETMVDVFDVRVTPSFLLTRSLLRRGLQFYLSRQPSSAKAE